jgi:hypothetical protein
MAVEAVTVGDLVERVAFVLTNSTSVPAGLSVDIKWALDAALDEFMNKYDHPAFRKEGSLSWVGGTRDYDLPDDFRRIIEPSLRYTEEPKYTLGYVELQEWDRIEADRFSNDTDRPRFYTIMGASPTTGVSVLRVLPEPTAAADLEFSYIGKPTPMRSASDVTAVDPRFPTHLHHGLVEMAVTKFPQYCSRDRIAMAESAAAMAIRDLARTAHPVIGNTHVQKRYGAAGRLPYVPATLTGSDLPPS